MIRRFASINLRAFFVLATFSLLSAPSSVVAADRIWDGGGADNNWSTPANWDGNLTAPVASDTLTFDGTVRLTNNNNLAADSAFGTITFAAGAGPYVVNGNRITLGGDIADSSPNPQTVNLPMILNANRAVSIDSGAMLTLGGVISGATFGLTKSGPGTLVLGANNAYTGATVIDGGTLAYAVDQTAVPSLTFGVTPTATAASTNVSTLDLTNASVTASSLNVQTNSTTANTITIGPGKALTVNGGITVGLNSVFTIPNPGANTVLNINGNSFVVNGGANNFVVGLARTNAALLADPVTTIDMSAGAGLSNFTYTATTGEFRVGSGNARSTVSLANTSNTITAAMVRISDSSLGVAEDNNGGRSIVHLGGGTNVINTNTLIVGFGKSGGTLDFAATATAGTLTVAGLVGGTSTADVSLGNSTSFTGSGDETLLSLAGHNVTVQGGAVSIGRLAGGSAGNSARGNVTFDTGTFNANSLQLAVNSSGAAPNGATGIFTLGGPNAGNTTATGVLNVASQFFLANRTNTTAAAGKSTGTFVINGGTANIAADILDASTTVSSAGSNVTTLTLDGGTLNIMGHNIGSYASPITTINLNSGNLNGAATIAGKTINLLQAVNITGAPNYVVGDGGTLNSSLPTITLVSGGGIGGGGPNGGTVSGEVVAGSGSRVSVGSSSVAGTLQFSSNLSLNGGSAARFKLSENASSGNDQISVLGNLALAGTVNLEIVSIGLGPQIGSKYTLINYGGTLTGNQSNFAIIDPKTRETFSVVPTATTPNSIQVSVGGAAPLALTWIGNQGNNWDLIGASNFRDASSTAQKFFNQDTVTFDDTSTNNNDVQLVGQLSPGGVTVSGNRNYKLAGTGGITGGGALTKNGNGTLTLASNNTYSGGTTINGGTLQVGDGGTSGSLGTGAIATEGALVFNRSNAVTIADSISGSAGTVRQEGTGTLTLSGNNTFAGGLSVNHGTARLISATAAGTGTLSVNSGATLVVGAALTVPMTLNGGTLGSAFGAVATPITTADITVPNAAVTVYTADPQNLATNGEVILTGTLHGSANINVLSGSAANNPDANPGFRLRGANTSDYTGTITIGHNVKGEIQNASIGPQSPAGTGKIVLLAGDATLGGTTTTTTLTGGYSEFNVRNNSQGDTTFGNDVQISGTGLALINPLGTAPANAVTTMGQLTIGAGQELGLFLNAAPANVLAFQSVILAGTAKFSPQTPGFGAATAVGSDLALSNVSEATSSGSGIIMTGLRTLYLNGTNTYHGPTQVLSGTLGGTGTVNSAVTVNSGASIAPGSVATPIGSFTAPSVALAGTLKIDLNDFDVNLQDVLNVTNALTLSNAAVNFNVTGTAVQPAYVFAHYGTLTGNPFTSFVGIPDGYTINYNYQNLKEIALVPASPLKQGDFNFDGHVNAADIQAMLTALTDVNKFKANNTLTDARMLTIGDFDASGTFNNADMQGLLNLLKSGGGSLTPVPEPASVVLLALALPGLAIAVARRFGR